MKILNFGSLNLDYTYTLARFAQPGETVACDDLHIGYGGKGLNQSIALARAGAAVIHAGCIGPEGARLEVFLRENTVDTAFIHLTDAPTGHAVIQVDGAGQNSIIVCGGANRAFTRKHIRVAAATLRAGDFALLQNETNLTDEAARRAKEKGAKVVLNPSPIDAWLSTRFPFDQVDMFILNETETAALTGETRPESMLDAMARRFPHAACVVTLGERGAWYGDKDERLYQAARETAAVDTTAAGDCFTGYFLAELMRGGAPADALAMGAAAAALAVSRPGAADSIPARGEVSADITP